MDIGARGGRAADAGAMTGWVTVVVWAGAEEGGDTVEAPYTICTGVGAVSTGMVALAGGGAGGVGAAEAGTGRGGGCGLRNCGGGGPMCTGVAVLDSKLAATPATVAGDTTCPAAPVRFPSNPKRTASPTSNAPAAMTMYMNRLDNGVHAASGAETEISEGGFIILLFWGS
jgi:hypothetical protein